MASLRDPSTTFAPIEVVERLIEITDHFGHKPVIFLSSTDDLATYLDSFGFDGYSLTKNTRSAFNSRSRMVSVLPNGSRSHDSVTAH